MPLTKEEVWTPIKRDSEYGIEWEADKKEAVKRWGKEIKKVKLTRTFEESF